MNPWRGIVKLFTYIKLKAPLLSADGWTGTDRQPKALASDTEERETQKRDKITLEVTHKYTHTIHNMMIIY